MSKLRRVPRIVVGIGVVLASALFCLSVPAQQGAPKELAPASARFSGVLLPAVALGERQVPLNVRVQVWHIDAAHKRELLRLPLVGMYVANQVSGVVTTTIDGISDRHIPGEFWVVPAGKSMLVKLEGQNSILQTISFDVSRP